MKRLMILAALCVALTACDMKPWPPSADYGSCLRGHDQFTTRIVYTGSLPSYTVGGFSAGGGMTVVPDNEFVCDEYEYPNGDGPEFQVAMKRYAAELQAWYERNPEERP